jgi:hypothetical protein
MDISWSIGATTYCYLNCFVSDKLLKPRKSFRITLYIIYSLCDVRTSEIRLNCIWILPLQRVKISHRYVCRSSSKVPVIIFPIKISRNHCTWSRVVPCGLKDMTKLIVAYRNLRKAQKICSHSGVAKWWVYSWTIQSVRARGIQKYMLMP